MLLHLIRHRPVVSSNAIIDSGLLSKRETVEATLSTRHSSMTLPIALPIDLCFDRTRRAAECVCIYKYPVRIA